MSNLDWLSNLDLRPTLIGCPSASASASGLADRGCIDRGWIDQPSHSLSHSLSHSHSHRHSHSHTLIHEGGSASCRLYTGRALLAPAPCVGSFMDECVAEAVAVAVPVPVTEAVAEADQSIHDQSIHGPSIHPRSRTSPGVPRGLHGGQKIYTQPQSGDGR